MNIIKQITACTLAIAALTATAAQARDGLDNHFTKAAASSNFNGGFGLNMSFNGRTRSNTNNGPRPVILRGVNFKFDSAVLTPASKKVLDAVAAALRNQTGNRLIVGGHASAEGDAPYNLNLSARRARAVRNYLVGKGVKAAGLSSAGYGEMHPIANNATEQGRSLNRRVELLSARTAF